MLWKSVLFFFLAVGALAEYQVTDEQRQQLRTLLSQYCKKNGAEDKAENVEVSIREFVDCVKTLFDPDEIMKEIEEAKPHGALDEVFKKYCAKSPELKTCIMSLTNSIAPCMDPNLRTHIGEFNNATSQLLDFVCYKDGDRIALFIAEGGPECFQEKTNAIRECANQIKDQMTSVQDPKTLDLPQHCAKYDEMSRCVVTALEGCSTPTPGNMAEALFKFIRKGSPCGTI